MIENRRLDRVAAQPGAITLEEHARRAQVGDRSVSTKLKPANNEQQDSNPHELTKARSQTYQLRLIQRRRTRRRQPPQQQQQQQQQNGQQMQNSAPDSCDMSTDESPMRELEQKSLVQDSDEQQRRPMESRLGDPVACAVHSTQIKSNCDQPASGNNQTRPSSDDGHDERDEDGGHANHSQRCVSREDAAGQFDVVFSRQTHPVVRPAGQRQVIVEPLLLGRKTTEQRRTTSKLLALLFLITIGLILTDNKPLLLSPQNEQLAPILRLIPFSSIKEPASCDKQESTNVQRAAKGGRVVLLASAEGAADIATHKSHWRNQIMTAIKYSASDPPPTVKTLSDSANMPGNPTASIYTQKPEPNVRIREGSAHLFRCATKEQMRFNYWTKNGMILFNVDMAKADMKSAERFTFIGDRQRFDYTIELRDAQLEDSGTYRCHTYTPPVPADNFLATSNLTVEAIPVMTQSPSALASEMDEHHIEASTQQLQHSQRSTILSHVSMPQSSLQSDSALQTVNLIQPPPHMMTRLPPPTRLLSARNTSSNSLKMDARFTMPFFWPYFLLALAAILMLTNIYLIYSLVKRHTRRNRSDLESPSSRERKLSSSSSSGVGSGQGSTSVHKLTK